VTTAPARGVVTHACSASSGRSASVSTTQSDASFGGRSTSQSLRNDLPGSPSRAGAGGFRPRPRTQDASLHSIAMGFGGDEHEDDAPGGRPGEDDLEFPRRPLPHPLDRLWMHPSELAPFTGAPAARPKPVWTTTLVAGAAGAILTLAVLG